MNIEQPPQNKIDSQKEINSGLFTMLEHHVSQFLLGSRISGEWYVGQLEKSISAIDELKKEIHGQEIEGRVDELLKKIQEIDTTRTVDDELLNEIQEKKDEVLNYKK